MRARDDYPKLHHEHSGPSHQGQTSQEAQAALDEIDHLRAANARLERDFADMNNHRRSIDVTGKSTSPIFCDAAHPDTECAGWLWYCTLIVGHLGPHRCSGASW